MGRNKWHRSLTKAERKRVKEGTLSFHRTSGDLSSSRGVSSRHSYMVYTGDLDAREVDARRQNQTSDNSWVHAVGFVILAAIVISWALGY